MAGHGATLTVLSSNRKSSVITRIALIAALAGPTFADAQAVTVFHGRPSIQIATTGASPRTTVLTEEKAEASDCVISQIGNQYYWATRENRRMVLIDTPSYLIYVAVDGAGYVKVVKPHMKDSAGLVDEAATQYDYVEHLPVGLASIAYYGRRR